jgi:hypothetical protein
MNTKTAFLAGVLAIFTLSIAAAKTYEITLSSPVNAGSVQLKAGEYKISINGSKVTFTDAKTSKSVTTDGKVENAAKSYDTTRMDTSTEGNTTVVKDIEVGGSKIKIEF